MRYIVTTEYSVDTEHHIAPHDLNTSSEELSEEQREAEAKSIVSSHFHPALLELKSGESFEDAQLHEAVSNELGDSDAVFVRIVDVQRQNLSAVHDFQHIVIDLIDCISALPQRDMYAGSVDVSVIHFSEIDVLKMAAESIVDRLTDIVTTEALSEKQ
jgi:hypothetical protein